MEFLLFSLKVFYNAFTNFFKDGIWIVGFLFLFIRVFERPLVQKIGKYLAVAALAILFINSVIWAL